MRKFIKEDNCDGNRLYFQLKHIDVEEEVSIFILEF